MFTFAVNIELVIAAEIADEQKDVKSWLWFAAVTNVVSESGPYAAFLRPANMKQVALGVTLLVLLQGCSTVSLLSSRSTATQTKRFAAHCRKVLTARATEDRFLLYRQYVAQRLDESAGTNSFRDKTGNCRLPWVDSMLRNPLGSIVEAERFTHDVHKTLKAGAAGTDELLTIISTALGIPAERRHPHHMPPTPASNMDRLTNTIASLHELWESAFAELGSDGQQELHELLLSQTLDDNTAGHRFADSVKGRTLCDILELVNMDALVNALGVMLELAGLANLEAATWSPSHAIGTNTQDDEMVGILHSVSTSHGRVLVAGPGDNVFDLSRMTNIVAIVDVGGNDTYIEGVVDINRPLLVILDLAGNDTYRGSRPGIQGGTVIGFSLLVDTRGDDTYVAKDAAQGSCLVGVGLLIDSDGNDTYVGDRRVQGHAMGGIGILLDRSGNDSYRGALLAQGVGAPLGIGILDDIDGADSYYAGGKYPGGYDDSAGFGGWSQGVGIGPRGSANGGIGVLLDGGGDDIYEYDYFSHGGGYWFAAGFARDFGGNDKRIGSTRTNFDGSKRTEPPFVRWGVGFGCHYALGFIIDDEGDDTYVGDHGCVAYTWDLAVGAILDFEGDDRYEASSSGVGQAYNAGVSFLFDRSGADTYAGRAIGLAGPKVDYHPIAEAGGNFTFVLDSDGTDKYPSGITNGCDHTRGWAGGYLQDK